MVKRKIEFNESSAIQIGTHKINVESGVFKGPDGAIGRLPRAQSRVVSWLHQSGETPLSRIQMARKSRNMNGIRPSHADSFDVVISKLRKLFGMDAIETVHKQGYRLKQK